MLHERIPTNYIHTRSDILKSKKKKYSRANGNLIAIRRKANKDHGIAWNNNKNDRRKKVQVQWKQRQHQRKKWPMRTTTITQKQQQQYNTNIQLTTIFYFIHQSLFLMILCAPQFNSSNQLLRINRSKLLRFVCSPYQHLPDRQTNHF